MPKTVSSSNCSSQRSAPFCFSETSGNLGASSRPAALRRAAVRLEATGRRPGVARRRYQTAAATRESSSLKRSTTISLSSSREKPAGDLEARACARTLRAPLATGWPMRTLALAGCQPVICVAKPYHGCLGEGPLWRRAELGSQPGRGAHRRRARLAVCLVWGKQRAGRGLFVA